MASGNSLGLDQPVARVSQTNLIITVWALVALALLCLLARVITNLYTFRRLHVADGFALFAFSMLVVNGALTTAMSPAMYELLAVSVGREQPTTAFMVRASYYLKCQFASTVVFWACLWSVKASFLAFFFQLTERLPWPRRAWWIITAVTILAFVGSIISYPLSCTSFTLGECSSPENARLSLVSLRLSTAVDIITDLCLIILPMSIIARVKVSRKQKLGLFAVMSLGLFIIAVSIARVVVTDTQGLHPEISWLALWSVVESSVAVLVCCLASFKTMFNSQQVDSQSRAYHAYGRGASRNQHDDPGDLRRNAAIVLSSIKVARSVVARESLDCDSSSQVEILGVKSEVVGQQRVRL